MWKFIKAFGPGRGILIALRFAHNTHAQCQSRGCCSCCSCCWWCLWWWWCWQLASFPCVLEPWKWNNWIFLLLLLLLNSRQQIEQLWLRVQLLTMTLMLLAFQNALSKFNGFLSCCTRATKYLAQHAALFTMQRKTNFHSVCVVKRKYSIIKIEFTFKNYSALKNRLLFVIQYNLGIFITEQMFSFIYLAFGRCESMWIYLDIRYAS